MVKQLDAEGAAKALAETFGPGGDGDDESPAPVKLGKFEGTPVLKTQASLHKTGDGLSDSLDIEPVVFHVGDEVSFVGRGRVRKVDHVGLKDIDGVARVHVVDATSVKFVGDELVAGTLDDHERRVALAKEEAAGVARLPGTEEA